MTFLVISDLVDYLSIEYRPHYSLTKAFYVALGLGQFAKTYYLTTGPTVDHKNIILKNINEIDESFLDEEIKYILIGREPILDDIFNQSKVLTDLIFNKERKQIIGVKSDTISWIWRNKIFLSKFNMNGLDFAANHIDIVYCQTKQFYKIETKKLRQKQKDNISVKISPMGVPDELPCMEFDINPYIIDTINYVKNGKQLLPNKALLPIPLCNNPDLLQRFMDRKDNKTVIIFMGRIKTERGLIAVMMRDIMKKLGNDYELHIFPGRFFLPGDISQVYSSKFNTNIEILRDKVFPNSENVFIHKPYSDNDKDWYLRYADIGIDFSALRPQNKKTPMGHCKLLEYCYYGLKVVADRNIINSDLVTSGKNGILLNNVPTVNDYVNTIKKLKDFKYDRQYTQKMTIKNCGWNGIANKIYLDFLHP